MQLPLPKHINEARVLETVLVEKDVDGFSAENIGNMCLKGEYMYMYRTWAICASKVNTCICIGHGQHVPQR